MPTFTEPFTTALSLTWTAVVGGALSVTGGTQGTLSGATDTRARAEHDVGSSDMFAQATWASGGADADRALSVATRYSPLNDSSYLFEVNDFFDRWQLIRNNLGTYTFVSGGTIPRTITTPTTLRLESEGATHRCYIDTVLVGTYTDSGITGNQRGGLTAWNPGGLIVIDDFSTGPLAVAPGTLRVPVQPIRIP